MEPIIPQKALLVAAYRGTASEIALCNDHLNELELLAATYGVPTAAREACHVRKFEASTFLTTGKVEELVLLANEREATIIIFDDEISPAQQRNLEKLFGRPVIDRTEVILNVFADRAQTKEARLQIELARVKYQMPRLRRLWTHLEKQGGSGGGTYMKGAGETQLELDKRMLKERVVRLNKEIEEVRAIRNTQRSARTKSEIPTFAIIGYTNAGKSTLLNALTNADVFVEDKLFATLDTTTRKYALGNNQDILLVDTVGFIRKLPHLLVAAFKSTLEEALYADILLHLVDVSHPKAYEQAETTFEVLRELNAEEKPIITILNKIDRCKDTSMIQQLRLKYPKAVSISALHHHGFHELQERMIEELERQRTKIRLRIPQSDYAIMSEILRVGNILEQEYEENDILIRVDLPLQVVGKYKKYTLS